MIIGPNPTSSPPVNLNLLSGRLGVRASGARPRPLRRQGGGDAARRPGDGGAARAQRGAGEGGEGGRQRRGGGVDGQSRPSVTVCVCLSLACLPGMEEQRLGDEWVAGW